MSAYLSTALVLIPYLVLAWLMGNVLKLKSPDIWILRIGLSLIGAAAAGVFLWFWNKKKKQGGAPGAGPAGEGGELDALLREAEAKLESSRLQGARFGNLPVIFIVGEAGSTKTSTVANSGLEPELLAGQVFQESAVVPTRTANLWYAREAVFVEAAGRLLGDAAGWTRLVRRMEPGKMRAAGKGGQAPRAAVVCFACDSFLKPGAVETMTVSARALHARLVEISQQLGINLPVYVLFTKMDRLAFFHEFVRHMTNEEASQVFGATLPFAGRQTEGVWAEREGARIGGALDKLFFSLSDHRPEMLSRENDPEPLPGVYEFPREFRKLRAAMTQFLVDLCRPSQLSTSPFLRGFYFSGVRPIVVKDVVAAAAPRPSSQPVFEAKKGASGMFKVPQFSPEGAIVPPAQPVQSSVSRKIPQWVFLNHFFSDVLLADHAGLGASGTSVKTNALRRVLLASAVALCLLLAVCFTVSFFGNRSLVAEARDAAKAAAAVQADPSLPSVESLAKLDRLRQSLETLTRYEREGAPLGLRWGLYAGHDVYPDVRRVYFQRFHQLLFGSTQGGLVATLQSLPALPGPADDYGFSYDTLKAYLITTSHPGRSTRAFLSPLLRSRWMNTRPVDAERAALAQKQFDFYSDELRVANPFSSQNDARSIERARAYLTQFAGVERVYRTMLDEANKSNTSLNFNQRFAGSAEVVVNNRDVAGAFTKTGWGFMQNAIRNADRYISGEEWVVGKQAAATMDRAKLEQELRTRYNADFINVWREYLKRGAVVRYADVRDAARKLNLTSGSQSPLLAMMWLASQNTGVESPEVQKAFRPLHLVMPPASVDQYIGPSNTDYMKALMAMQVSLEQVAGQTGPAAEAAASQTVSQAVAAKLVTRQMAQGFGVDPDAHLEAVIQKLMEDPITYTENLLRSLGPAELNGKGRGFCAQYRQLLAKYPFNPSPQAPRATVEDVNAVFAPQQGLLWQFYEQSLQKYLTKQGAPNPSGGLTLAPRFLEFFRSMASVSNALYPGGATQPKLSFSLKPSPTPDLQSMKLTIDGQTLESGTKTFNWQAGAASRLSLSARFRGAGDQTFYNFTGPWAVFDFFLEADTWNQPGAIATVDWVSRTGSAGRAVATASGQPMTVRLDLDMAGGPSVFQKGFFQRIGCVADIAR